MRFTSIGELSSALANGSISALEICDLMLAAIESDDPAVGAYSDIIAASARLEAQASDRRRAKGETLGPLDGIPIAIKDLIDTVPAICSAGLDHLSEYRPVVDAEVVRSLRAGGAVVLGVTETDPGAFSTDTLKVHNPLAHDRIVGGSSGGSAAAVAAGLAFAAIGTDTGGSIRIPAACSSIYGFKPSWGRVNTGGIRPLASSLDHAGPLARSMADLRIVQSILDPSSLEKEALAQSPLSIGICLPYFADATTVVCGAMDAITSTLQSCGVTLKPVFLPDPDHVLAFHLVNLPKEAADYHAASFPLEWHTYPQIARDTVALGLGISAEAYAQAETRRNLARSAVDLALQDVDAIILPTMPMDAPLRDDWQVELGGRSRTRLQATVRYTALFNQTGHPVVSMPAAPLADGRALSIQVVGRSGDDAKLLNISSRIEAMLSLDIDYARLSARPHMASTYPHDASAEGDTNDSRP